MGERGSLGQGRFVAAKVERHTECQLSKNDGLAGVQPSFVFCDHGQTMQSIEPDPAPSGPRRPGESGLEGGQPAGDLIALCRLGGARPCQAIRQPAEFRRQGLQMGP